MDNNAHFQHPLECPCICFETDYDNQGFFDFPTRKGWEIKWESQGTTIVMVRTDHLQFDQDVATAFLQAWMFFGTLSEVISLSGIQVRQGDFIRKEGDQRLFTMILFDRYLEDWAVCEVVKDRSQYPRKLHAATQCLMQVRDLLECPSGSALGGFLNPEVISFTRVLVHALYACANAIWGQSSSMAELNNILRQLRKWRFKIPRTKFPFDYMEVGFVTPRAPILDYVKMLRANWCPRDVKALGPKFGFAAPVVYFASTLSRPDVKKSHSTCLEDECTQKRIDESRYVSKHVISGCDCVHLEIDAENVVSILENGGIPRISVGENEAGSFYIVVTDTGPYVAISHVWSDGLGNARTNSLPQCQLLRLKNLAVALFKEERIADIPIWIDTLCVPLKPKGRKLALRKLGKMYEEANKVLVLDAELEKSTRECSEEEWLMRICFSGWMQRLWTLEEGVVGRDRLFFQFAEGTVNIPTKNREEVRLFRQSILGDIIEYLFNHIPLRPNFENTEKGMQLSGNDNSFPDVEYQMPLQILTAIQYRQTTKRADETLCIASICRLDQTTIVAASSANERMKAFLNVLADLRMRVSTAILFTSEPKLQEDGYRWAPESLMTLSKGMNRREPCHPFLQTWITKDGSYYNTSGLICSLPAKLLSGIRGAETTGLWGKEFHIADENEITIEVWKAVEEQDCYGHNSYSRLVADNHLAIILDDSNNEDDTFAAATAGLIVSIYRKEDMSAVAGDNESRIMIYARYIIRVFKTGQYAAAANKKSQILLGEKGNNIIVTADTKMLNKFEWCIG
ncbi:MAG: hypothetical protein M1834_007531 [Cirrosporium novae-zelandiae]|nr:MAG: hypothetical protein M1834_007531 [Cirrosporium novae-zelandiae]